MKSFLQSSLLVALSIGICKPQDASLADESKRATAYMSDGNYAAAIPLYRHLVQAVPGNPGLILDLGLAQFMSGHPKDAVPQFEVVLKSQPDNVPALSSLASCRLQLRQPAQAIAPLQKLLSIDPTKSDTRGMLAGALMALERYPEAVDQYQKIAVQNREDARAWYGLGSAYEALAGRSFARLEKLAPQSAYVLELIADSQASRGQFRSAFYFYRQAESKLPKLPGIHSGLSRVYDRTDHKEWAQEELERESGLPGPDCSQSPKACAFRSGQFQEAVKNGATGTEDLFWAVKAYNELALESFEKLGHLPESAEIHALKATLFKQHRQYQQSSTEWKAAVKLDPVNLDLQHELEAALFLSQEYDLLLPMLEKEIQKRPEAPEINFRLGECLVQMQQAEKALPYLQKAAKSPGAPDAAHASLGMALMQLGRPAEAVPEIEKSVREDDTGSLHYQLARAYQATGNPEKGRQAMLEYQAIQERNKTQDDKLSKEAQITGPQTN